MSDEPSINQVASMALSACACDRCRADLCRSKAELRAPRVEKRQLTDWRSGEERRSERQSTADDRTTRA